MIKYFIILICVPLIKAQYGSKYRALASENYHSLSSDEDMLFPTTESRIFKRNREFDFAAETREEDFTNGVEPKTIASVIDGVQEIMTDIKMNMNEEFKHLTTLDEENQQRAKKTIADTRTEIDDRVGYVEQLLFKKREGAVGSNPNVMHCVTDSLSKLGRIAPALMKEEERCITSELDVSRAVGKVTLDMLKENLHKIKIQQERLNKCTTMQKRRKVCFISVFNELSRFKKTVESTMSSKMTESVSYLTALPSRLRTCSMTQLGKAVTRAGDVIVKFNTCVKGLGGEVSKKKKAELLLFVV